MPSEILHVCQPKLRAGDSGYYTYCAFAYAHWERNAGRSSQYLKSLHDQVTKFKVGGWGAGSA